MNYKVILGESLTTQHRVLVMDVRVTSQIKKVCYITQYITQSLYKNEGNWNKYKVAKQDIKKALSEGLY